MKIGILVTGHPPDELRSDFGTYDGMFRTLLGGNGFTFQTYNVVDGQFPDGTDSADGWVITGSRHGAYEDHAWIPPLENLIRAIRDKGQPLIGVCFGHQIIAQALGGKVEKFTGGWAVGRTDYDLDGQTVTLNAWHQDQVVALPDGARVTGTNDFCRNAMVAYGDTIWTVQAHPEYGDGFIQGLIQTRGKGVVPDELMQAATDRLPANDDNPKIGQFMAEFLKKERA
ncbi:MULTISPECIES: type 1 glutamine amidotransferase [unclassified Ruegeria]|uniref:type 1 glutamine amidotransferase n=1 Tax=unclassified Ruegeria TaxID=2625375 RepID=UPI001ADAD5CB|nr:MULTISPECIES: type 1 glutamine amidotransferase [unclassified Ruegeria]MBO9410300.1 type 1 glutamine amidotransferase [Ruegeria sp. R8_1]MBO9414481.1 type 1 glutamine amidotransferase [Ruegeria sp. R8_2]